MAYPDAPGAAEKEKVLQTISGPKALLGRYAPKWEAQLERASGGPFFLGAEPSIADVGVFELLDYFRDVFGSERYQAAFAPFPRLLRLVVEVKQLGRLAEHCDEGRKAYDTWDEAAGAHTRWGAYMKAVRTTLA
jgi:glutathione S-transferase